MGLKNSLKTEPLLKSEIEVSLIGTGGGYGESIVVHLGNNNWIVVDSCINPKTKSSLPLEYLMSKGVDVANDVKAIICTHWHDDHILGISELLAECRNSVFCMAGATDQRKFLMLVGLDYHKVKSESSASSTKELSRCIEIIEKRPYPVIKKASQDKTLYRFNEENISAEVISLSPSDFVLGEFDKEISDLMTEYALPNRKIVPSYPNDKSVVLHIKINNKGILLGADLEVNNDRRKGWFCILDQSQCISLKSSLFKIPHHGSENSYHDDIWDKLLLKNPVAKLTPWNRNTKLPKLEMLRKYNELTSELYITTLNQTSNTPKKRDNNTAKTIQRVNKTLREVKYSFGIVRSRLDANRKDSKWSIECIDRAEKITKLSFK